MYDTLPGLLAALPRLLADSGGNVDLSVFAQYGVLGIVTAGLVWFAKGAHQREKDRSDRLEAENQRLNSLIIDRAVPALATASRAAEECAELLRSIQREREQERERQQLMTHLDHGAKGHD